MQSAASKSSLASLVIEYFFESLTYLWLRKNVLISTYLDPLQLLLLFLNVVDQFELFLFDVLSMLLQVLHLLSHLLKLLVVDVDFLLLFLHFLLSCN